MQRAHVVGVAIAGLLAVVLSGCAGHAGAQPSGAVTPTPRETPTAPSGASVTIGALPERSSVLLHGRAPLASPDPAMEEDLRTLAKDTNADPDDVIRDYAAQPAFDEAIRIAEDAHVGYADAVFHAGEQAASELRFVDRPPQRLLDALAGAYPRDLRVEWGEHLVGDHDRDRLSETVFGIVRRVADTGNVSTGIDGDGRLGVDFDGSATPRAVADAILAAPAFRDLFVDGQPPTEVRVRHVPDNAASFG